MNNDLDPENPDDDGFTPTSLFAEFMEIHDCFMARSKNPNESWEEFLEREPEFTPVYEAICREAEAEERLLKKDVEPRSASR